VNIRSSAKKRIDIPGFRTSPNRLRNAGTVVTCSKCHSSPPPSPPSFFFIREVTNRAEFAYIRSLYTNFVSTQNQVRCSNLNFPRTLLRIVTNKRKLFSNKQSLDSSINNKAWAIRHVPVSLFLT